VIIKSIELERQKEFQLVISVVKNTIMVFIVMNIDLYGDKIKIENNGQY
jgi:hypothetical protein